jgi:transcriptional regulator with XRE-family HTH domain
MAESIDIVRLGERLRRVRDRRGLTLRQVADATKISIPTLSRIERGGANELESGTLLALSEWLGTSVEKLADKSLPQPPGAEGALETPDVVELYLRADKKLNKKTAEALAHMFRTAYETVAQQNQNR